MTKKVVLYFATYISVKPICAHQISKKAGTDAHKSIIHFALKGKLMHDARLITQKDVLPLVDPINFVLINFYETLRVCVCVCVFFFVCSCAVSLLLSS